MQKDLLNCSISAWLTALKSQLYFGNNRGQRLPKPQRKETEEPLKSRREQRASSSNNNNNWQVEHQSRGNLRQVHSTWVFQLTRLIHSTHSPLATFACRKILNDKDVQCQRSRCNATIMNNNNKYWKYAENNCWQLQNVATLLGCIIDNELTKRISCSPSPAHPFQLCVSTDSTCNRIQLI